MLTIYTKSFCQKCDDIKRRLDDKKVEYAEKSSEDQAIMQDLIALLTKAGLTSPVLPVIEFDDGSIVSNDMGLYKELKHRGIL